MNSEHERNAVVLKAFCNVTRLQVLERLRSGEKCACDLMDCIDVSQSNLSHHMKVLIESGVVRARQEGRWTFYSIDAEGAERASALVCDLTKVVETAEPTRCCSGTFEGGDR